MPAPSKVELYAAIRRVVRAGMPVHAIERKFKVGRHTVKRIFDRPIDEYAMIDVSYQVVRAYVAVRKPEIRIESGRCDPDGPPNHGPVMIT